MDQVLQREIENEYKKIDRKWLSLHFFASAGLVVLAFILECVIGRILYLTGEINTSIPLYLMKFLIIPSILNATFLLINFMVIRSKTIDQNFKINTVSYLYVAHCFVVFTVHSTFSALFIIFSVPILLTAIYGKYKLSTITATFSIAALVVSELFIPWDTDKISVLENGIRLGDFVISVCVLIFFYAVSMMIIYFEREKNAAGLQKEMERYKLGQRLLIDELTGIYNRVAFRNIIDDMEGDTSDTRYIFVMIDLDNFKLLNDTLGHLAGDQCLTEFGRILKINSENATPFRYGGDEFSQLFKNTTMAQVVQRCERIQQDFESIDMFQTSDILCTVSFGVAAYSSEMTPSQLILKSDKALYQSKVVRNKITVYDDSITIKRNL